MTSAFFSVSRKTENRALQMWTQMESQELCLGDQPWSLTLHIHCEILFMEPHMSDGRISENDQRMDEV